MECTENTRKPTKEGPIQESQTKTSPHLRQYVQKEQQSLQMDKKQKHLYRTKSRVLAPPAETQTPTPPKTWSIQRFKLRTHQKYQPPTHTARAYTTHGSTQPLFHQELCFCTMRGKNNPELPQNMLHTTRQTQDTPKEWTVNSPRERQFIGKARR